MKRAKKLLGVILLVIAVMGLSLNVQAAVKLSKTKVTLIKGQTVTLKIKGTTAKPKWKSSKPAVASVSSKGLVKAKKKGTAVITAAIKNKTYKCKVTVETPKINKTEAEMYVGDELTLEINGTKQKIKWSTDDGNVVSVSDGVVTAKSEGEVSVTAKIGKKKYTCAIMVKEPENNSSSSSDGGSSNEGSSSSAGIPSYVWIPRTGSKYHSSSTCSRMRNPSYVSLSDAVARGYTACSKCF